MLVSEDNAGLYNPKVIQSTMGSFLRVNVTQCNIETVLSNNKLPVYGAVLSGAPLARTKMQAPCFLVIGNESKGIRTNLQPFITHPVTITSFGAAESLNAAVATGILLSSWRA
jgi:TrmH family RNA methyltransferase